MAAQTTDGTGIELVIETVAISKGNSVAEIFATEAELLAANRNDGAIGYAQDTQLFYFRADNTWSPTGGAGVQIYATEADILADTTASAGTIAYVTDIDTYYFKKSTEWQALAVGGGEANLGGNVGTGQQIYRTKSGVTLQFRSLTAASGKVSVTQNDLDVSLDVVPGNIQHQSLAGVGTNTHAQIDSQLSDFADHAADVTIHRSIDDSGTSNTDLFSAAHILSELALKRDTATLIDHEVDVSHVGVNTHDEIDAGLADSAAHIADGTIHHVINDASVSTTDLLSASKITSLVSPKADDSAVIHITGNEVISGVKTFSQTISGSVDGSASQLQTARTINGVAFDGTGDITVPTGARGLIASNHAPTMTLTADNSGFICRTDYGDCTWILPDATTSPGVYFTFEQEGGGAVTVQAASGDSIYADPSGGASINGSNSQFPGVITLVSVGSTYWLPVSAVGAWSPSGQSLVDAGTLAGATLSSGVTASSLSSLGTVTHLTATDMTVTNPISGDLNGSAMSADVLTVARNINGVPFDGSADITISAGGGPVNASDLAGATLAASVVNSSLTSVGTLNGLNLTGVSHFADVGAGLIFFLDALASGGAADFVFRRGGDIGTGGCEFVYDTRSGYPWTGSSGAGMAFIMYGGDRLTLGISAADYSKFGAKVDADAQHMEIGCQLRLLNLASDPTAMGPGATYFNTTTNQIKTYNGTTWEAVGSGGGSAIVPELTGDVTTTGSSNVTTLDNAAVIGQALTGFSASAGVISAADSLVAAIGKLAANISAKADDTAVVHNSGDENITGVKTFVSPIAASITGGAATATAFATARSINGIAFDGTANVTVTAAANTLTGTSLASGVVSSSLTSVGTLVNLAVTNPITGSVTGNAATVTTNANLTGDATSVGNAVTLSNAAVIGQVLTGYTSGAGTVSAADSILTAIQKLNGNIAALGAAAAGTLTGTTLAANVVTSSLTTIGTLANLTVSGVCKLGNGSAAAPAYGFTGSPSGVGMYSGGTNVLNFATAGTMAMSINAQQTVTIVTKLTCNGLLTMGQALQFLSAPGDPGITLAAGQMYFNNASKRIRIYDGTAWSDAGNPVMTGYTAGAGTVSASDTPISAIQKLDGNIGLKATDTAVVHLSGAESITGLKSFTSVIALAPLAADPTGTAAGQVYFNNTSNKIKIYNGSAWETVTST